jgi:hypothetical protein
MVLLGLFSTEIADSDFWWHLKTGEYIVTQERLPSPDPFAYTTAGARPGYPGEETTRRFNLTHEWLAQAVWYLVYRIGGFPAVVLWKALLLATLCALAGFVAERRTGSWLWGIAAALAAASLAVEFAKDRPGILSYVFTAAFLAIFEGRRRLWIVPVLAVVWANCHGGFFLGWIVCAAYAAEALLRRSPDARRILAAGGLAVLLTGANPNGFSAIARAPCRRRSSNGRGRTFGVRPTPSTSCSTRPLWRWFFPGNGCVRPTGCSLRRLPRRRSRRSAMCCSSASSLPF